MMGRVSSRSVIWILSALLTTGCGPIRRFMYAGFDRDDWQQPDRVIESLRLEPGSKVADVGAGGGYFTFRLADAVGKDGRVYAVDVDEEMTTYLSERAAEEGASNVEVVLAPFDDPTIPATVDLIFTCNTYHHIESRTAYFQRTRQYLADGGLVAIVELKDEGWFQKLFAHNTPKEVIRSEMEAAGYLLANDYDFLERQSFLIFEAAGP